MSKIYINVSGWVIGMQDPKQIRTTIIHLFGNCYSLEAKGGLDKGMDWTKHEISFGVLISADMFFELKYQFKKSMEQFKSQFTFSFTS